MIQCSTDEGSESYPMKAVQRGLLALNAAVYTRGDGSKSVNGWVITHVPTGLALCRCRSVWKARRALRALVMCGNWDRPTPIVDGRADTSAWPQSFKKKAMRTAKRFHEHPYWHHP
jgi:hypothetical protein